MAKDDSLENRSEYQPPTSPPRARVPSKREFQSVKLDPTIDRRRAKTQISQRSMARASRSYTMTAFVAGALGALTASGVYLAMNDDGESTEPSASARRPATLDSVSGSAVRTGTLEGVTQPRPLGAPAATAQSLDVSAVPSVRPSPAATSLDTEKRHRPSPTPSNTPRSAATQNGTPSNGAVPNGTPEQPPDAPAPPESSGSSKAWVDTPPRKVWVQ